MKRRMQPFPVVNPFDERSDPLGGVRKTHVFRKMHLLRFQRLHKTLSLRIVVRIALPRHTDAEFATLQQLDVIIRCVLLSPVAVVDYAPGRVSLLDRLTERHNHHAAVDVPS